MATDNVVFDGSSPVESKVVVVPSHEINEKNAHGSESKIAAKGNELDYEINAAPTLSDGEEPEKSSDNEDAIIVTGFDAAQHLLPLRDDFEPALTFRSIFLASCLSAFQAVMSQIYSVREIPWLNDQQAATSNTQLGTSSNRPKSLSQAHSSF